MISKARAELDKFKKSGSFWRDWVLSEFNQQQVSKAYGIDLIRKKIEHLPTLESLIADLEKQVRVLRGMHGGSQQLAGFKPRPDLRCTFWG